jgi:pimeloyl-ACP methyl ester carboxylesterase
MTSPKLAQLRDFRMRYPEKVLRVETADWRYRVLGASSQTLLVVPGGELVNDLGFEFALAMSGTCRIIYPAYPNVSSIEEIADGLRAILDTERIDRTAILGASFGGAVAQIFVRSYPNRVSELILSNTGVPLPYLTPPIRVFEWIAKALPWPLTAKLLRRPMLKTLDAAGSNEAFWNEYLDELFSSRLKKADVLSNIRIQLDYHRRFRFLPSDLERWPGRILIAESDNDVIGPRRRRLLRQTYPGSQLHTYHAAGHAPMFTRFDEYLAMVKGFFGNVRAAE